MALAARNVDSGTRLTRGTEELWQTALISSRHCDVVKGCYDVSTEGPRTAQKFCRHESTGCNVDALEMDGERALHLLADWGLFDYYYLFRWLLRLLGLQDSGLESRSTRGTLIRVLNGSGGVAVGLLGLLASSLDALQLLG